MIEIGKYNRMKVLRQSDIGVFLDDGDKGILLPKRFVPQGTKLDDEVEVFLYHDSDNRVIATTQRPFAVAGDIAMLKVVGITPQGAFLDWGLMKDLFVAKSQQHSVMRVGGKYLVLLYIDAQTGRIAATEKIDRQLNNDDLTVEENEQVNLVVYRRSDIGYVVIINGKHTGVLYFDQVFEDLEPGDTLTGFIKKIRPDNKIDVIAGARGYEKVDSETDKVLGLLKQHDGYLPYNDKSDPEEIYRVFGMSKKTFKMTTGALYKQRKISFTQTGIKLEE